MYLSWILYSYESSQVLQFWFQLYHEMVNVYFLHKIKNKVVKCVNSEINNRQFYVVYKMHFPKFHFLNQQNALIEI
jgi:hypothetical protein